MTTQKFVYHLVPKQLEGNILYPLNRLQKIYPEIAMIHAKKYVGREILQAKQIPLLDCLWNDVLMFSPVHPQFIMQTFRDEGYELKPKQWFEIPLSRLERQQTVAYLYRKQAWGDFSTHNDDFIMLADAEFDELSKQTDALQEHIHTAQSENRYPFLFVGIPHILYKGTLLLEGIRVVEF